MIPSVKWNCPSHNNRFDVIEKFIKGFPLHEKGKNQWFELSNGNMESFSHIYFIS